MAWKIFAGVLGALLAFWLIVMFVTGVFVIGAGKALDQQVQATLQQEQQQAQRQAQQFREQQMQAMQRQQAALRAQQAYEASRRQLAPNQRCVGGTVITVDGTSYTQVIGGSGRPVKCSGGVAGEPLR